LVARNDLGVEIAGFYVAYTGEQWRKANNATQQSITFDYRIGTNLTTATELATGAGFTAVSGLDFTGPVATTTTAAALDGNLAANRAVQTASVTLGTSWTAGDLALRWTDIDNSSTDHGLAVDDFKFQAVRRLVWTGGTGGSAGQWSTSATSWKSGTTADNAVAYANLDAAFAGTLLSDAGGDAVEFTNAGIGNNTVTLSGSIKPTSVAVSNTSGTYTFTGTGSIDGSTALTKTGAGTLVIANANTYTGGTTISGGTLLANNTTGSATGSGTVVVASGGTLGGTGTVRGVQTGTGPLRNVELQAGGSIQPGSPTDPLGNLKLNSSSDSMFSGGTLKIQVGSSPTASSKLTLAGGGGLDLNALTSGSKLNIELTAATGLTNNTQYTITVLDNIGTGSITYDSDGFNANKFNITATNFEVNGDGFHITAGSGNQLVISFTPVPEPAVVLGVAAGVLGLGRLIRRRPNTPAELIPGA
jgi:autotransporter-associated beta strand protein